MKFFVLLSLLLITRALAENPPIHSDERGTWLFQVTSQHTAGENPVEVLLPDNFDSKQKYRVLYLLPVEAKLNHRFGDGVKVLRDLGAHNKYNLIVVAPTFDTDPWYGNHATDPHRQYEKYLIDTVVPMIENRYPTSGTSRDRLLLGYSKSGWGAITLILRHPDFFGFAASWDAPLMFTEKQFGIWKTNEVFGTAENMAHYLPSTLLREHAAPFQNETRLILAGKNLFGTFTDARFPYDGPSHLESFHEMAQSLGVKHQYAPNLKANHSLNETWVKPVLEQLVSISNP